MGFGYAFTLVFGSDEDAAATAAATGAGSGGRSLPQARDLYIDPNTHDLKLFGGDLGLVADREAIRQEADIRFNFLLGEWFLDITKGVPWFQKILVKSPDMTAIRAILTDEALKVAGIKSLLKMTLARNLTTRRLRVEWAGESDLGTLSASTSVEQ